MKKYVSVILIALVLVTGGTLSVLKFLSLRETAREETEELLRKEQLAQAQKEAEAEEKNTRELIGNLYKDWSTLEKGHYTITYEDGSVVEECFNKTFCKRVFADLEVYSNERWVLEIDRKNKTYIAQEKIPPGKYPVPNEMYAKEQMPVLKNILKEYHDRYPKKTGNSEYQVSENLKVEINEDFLPVKVTTWKKPIEIFTAEGFPINTNTIEKTMELNYLQGKAPLKTVFPEPPSEEYVVRILYLDDYSLIGDAGVEVMEGSDPVSRRSPSDRYISYNYTGTIAGNEVSVYIQRKSEPKEGLLQVFCQGKTPRYYSDVSLSENNLIVKNDQGEIVFKGQATEESMQGDWNEEQMKQKGIRLYTPPLSSILTFYPYGQLDIADCFKAKNHIGLINNTIIDYHQDLLRVDLSMDEEELKEYYNLDAYTGSNIIRCNEMGILCLEIYVSPPDDQDYWYTGTLTKTALFDLVSGTELSAWDLFVKDYKDRLKEAGYDLPYSPEHTKPAFCVLPNGIEWQTTEDYDEFNYGGLFLTWEELVSIIKPEGPLYPFLVKNKLATVQQKIPVE